MAQVIYTENGWDCIDEMFICCDDWQFRYLCTECDEYAPCTFCGEFAAPYEKCTHGE